MRLRLLTKLSYNLLQEIIFMEKSNSNRKKILNKTLNSVIEDIKKYSPEKIIIFGSIVSGKITETSDIDILIVKNTRKRYFERIKDVINLCNYDIGIDFFVYTPKELEEEIKNNIFVREEIIKKGKIVYDKAV
ncbi:nucleotidyltransferase domain-containing protein [bacterium]